MPDGFDPHVELARIATLRDMMVACRERLPLILRTLDEAFSHKDIYIRMKAMEFASDRGFGKPRQQVVVTDTTDNNKVQLYIPDNKRSISNAKTIEVVSDSHSHDE